MSIKEVNLALKRGEYMERYSLGFTLSASLTFVSSAGQPFSLCISQECSGIASISIFLLLMALMYMDIRPRGYVSVLFAAAGSLLFLFLNSLGVVFIVLGGIVGGACLMWSLHGWVGYVLYVAGCTGIVLVYTRTAAGKAGARAAPGRWKRQERWFVLDKERTRCTVSGGGE
jgi:exosortase/archaeosortase family protein